MPEWIPGESRPCQPGECDFHSEHRPCDRGWLDADHVCPCWSARRRLEVHHTGAAEPVTGTPMPANVRGALHAARRAAAPAPVPTAAATPAAEPEPEPDAVPVAVDPAAAAVLDAPQLAEHPISPAERTQLLTAITAALAAGWTRNALINKLAANLDTDRPPARLWLYTLTPSRLGRPQLVLQVAA